MFPAVTQSPGAVHGQDGGNMYKIDRTKSAILLQKNEKSNKSKKYRKKCLAIRPEIHILSSQKGNQNQQVSVSDLRVGLKLKEVP